MGIVEKIKEKREFSGIPDDLVKNVLQFKQIKNKSDMDKIKLTRAFLRKYFGVFLTNKVMKGNGEVVLNNHISSKKRDYSVLYKTILEHTDKKFKSVVDLGCGVNGFSYSFLAKELGEINYSGVEAVEQLCKMQNDFFSSNKFSCAKVEWGNLFDFRGIEKIVSETKEPRLFLLLQIIDALENIEPNFSKIFLLKLKDIAGPRDVFVVSNPMKSISGKSFFKSHREWLNGFVKENFKVMADFCFFDERF